VTALDARPAVLGSTEPAQVDALWRAANYLAAGRIYPTSTSSTPTSTGPS
jgi:xylulose-5-phosphate/fructose-6-phosphate phosphoketolase